MVELEALKYVCIAIGGAFILISVLDNFRDWTKSILNKE